MAEANPYAQFTIQANPAPEDTAPNPYAQFVATSPQPGSAGALLNEQQDIRRGVVRGIQDIPEGAIQFGAHAGQTLSPAGSGAEGFFGGGAEAADKYIRDQEEAYEKSLGHKPPNLDVGRIAGNTLATAPVAYAMPGAAAESLWGRMLSGLASGGVSGAMQPVNTQAGDYWQQKGYQTGAGAVGGAAPVPGVGAVARTISGATNPNVKQMVSEGVAPTIGQIVGKWFGPLEERLSSIPGVGDVIANARVRATQDMNRAAINRPLSHIGESLDPKTPLGRDAIREMDDKVGGYFDNLLPKLTWRTDPHFENSVVNIANNTNWGPGRRDQFIDLLSGQFAKAKNGILDGKTFKEIDSKLGSEASGYQNTGDADQKNLGYAIKQAQLEFRNALTRSNPQHAQELNNANAAYADAIRVKTAAARPGADEGLFSAPQLAGAVRQMDPSLRKGAYAKGEARMQDFSDAAKNVLGNKVPDSGTAGRSLAAIAAGATAGGAGYEHVMPHVTLPLAGAVGGGLAAYTPIGQRALAKVLASRPDVAAPIASAVRRTSPLASSALANTLAGNTVP